ncbi:MAG: LysM peptidoglycan-binding domain-containing protein [Desulfuromonadales bacterium]|nr:LysM peptidoglycan-binding domain-containing protein [Desulfuromonadales bacterium]
MRFFKVTLYLLAGLTLAGCFSTNIPLFSSEAFEESSPQPLLEVGVPAVPVDEATDPSHNELLADSLFEEVVEENFAEQAEPLDAATLADNQLLQGVDQNPPEDPGQTLALQEPVYDFPVVENEKVRYYVDYYTGRARKTFKIWLERSGRYLPMMREIFAEAGLPKDLAYLAMVESGFNDKAYSWAHAVGPWQFIESTGRRYGLKNDWWHDERRDPEKATRAAAHFLSDLYKSFDGDWYLAVPSYNAGPGKLRQAVKRYKTRDFWELSRGKYLKAETKNYLPKLLAVILIAKQPEKYGFTDLEYQEPIAYETMALPSSTDLEVLARLSGSDYSSIKKLNPELKRWCTPPASKGFEVRLPVGSQPLFSEKYAQLPKRERANYVRHKVKSGDTLLALSHRYGVRVTDIKRLNSIKNSRTIQIGTNLIVPLNPDSNGLKPLAELKDDYKRSRLSRYTVRPGDSLWKISRKFNVTEKQLRVWNKLGWSNTIRPGQSLIVSSKKTAKKRIAKVKKTSGPVTKMLYTVRSGDTLWAIGREFAVDAGQIRSWNNLAENHVLQPGESLTLHVSSNRG